MARRTLQWSVCLVFVVLMTASCVTSFSRDALSNAEVLFVNGTGEVAVSSLDMGVWLDGFPGSAESVYVANVGTEPATVSFALLGHDQELFCVEADFKHLEPGEMRRIFIRYRGELDPGELLEKTAELRVRYGWGSQQTLSLRALPVVDHVWALHCLLAEEISVSFLQDLLVTFEGRTYPEARLAEGIIRVHLFALGEGNDTQAMAEAAYASLSEIDVESDLRTVYHGVASAFVASKRGAFGGAYLDSMQELFESLPVDNTQWYSLFWKGVTYLRTSKGIMDDLLAWTFGGFRSRINNIWVPGGQQALAQVRAAYHSASMPEGVAMDGFTYERDLAPVPYGIRVDVEDAPLFDW